jgi:hypothetical protein
VKKSRNTGKVEIQEERDAARDTEETLISALMESDSPSERLHDSAEQSGRRNWRRALLAAASFVATTASILVFRRRRSGR